MIPIAILFLVSIYFIVSGHSSMSCLQKRCYDDTSYTCLLCLQLDSLEWHKRPLPITLEGAAVKNCIFMLHLQKKVHEALMLPFYQCVDVFLNLVRDADQAEASEHQV
jgi:hypothetical protein